MKAWKAAVVTLLLTLSVPARAGLIEDMVQLERAYVPALALTNQPGKDALARDATRRLAAGWERFRQVAAPEAANDATLASALDESGASIARALAMLERGGSLKEAHDALEAVRSTLWKWRAGKGIAFFPDLLTAFHEPMEHLADLMVAPSADQARIKQTLQEAVELWKQVESARFDPVLYGFPNQKVDRMKGLIAKEREILSQIGALAAGGDRERLAGAAKSMKGNFAQIYFLFGDFTGLP